MDKQHQGIRFISRGRQYNTYKQSLTQTLAENIRDLEEKPMPEAKSRQMQKFGVQFLHMSIKGCMNIR